MRKNLLGKLDRLFFFCVVDVGVGYAGTVGLNVSN
jgi:hypothetical protein